MQTTATQEFLATISPFNQLPEAARIELLKQSRLERYSMGHPILQRTQIPQQVAILYQGQARLIGFDPRIRKEVTLEILQPGALIGYLGLLRGVACETVLAREDVICLILSAQQFWTLLKQYPPLQDAWQNRCALIEAFELLGQELERQALGDADLKQLAEQAASVAEIRYLPTGRTSSEQLDPSQMWFFSGGGSVNNLPIGSLVYANQTYLDVKNQPARLVGLPILAFRFLLFDRWFQEEVAPQDERQHDTTDERQRLERLVYQPASVEDENYGFQPDKSPKSKLPYVRGKGAIAAPLACMEMIAKQLELPFRRSILNRIFNDQLQRAGSLSLALCAAVAEVMGLNAQTVKIPATALLRLPTPALIRWQDSFAVLYEVSTKEVVLGVPERGIRRYKKAQFLDIWGEDGQVLLLQKSSLTPHKKFGLQWFIPALSRYRKVLVEVLLASFFVQLFGLANPLVVQRIIDLVISQNSLDTLPIFGIFLLVMAIFEVLLTSLRTYLFSDATNRIDLSLGSEIIEHLLHLPLPYFQKRPVGELASRIGELETIRSFLTGTALTAIIDTLFSIIYILVMAVYSWQLTLVALATVPVFLGLTLLFSPLLRRQLRAKAERGSHTQSYLVEVLSGIQTVKAQNIELNARRSWQKRYARYVKASFKTVVTSTLSSSASSFINKVSQLLVLWLGAYLVASGDLTLGELIAFRIIAGYVTSPLMRLAHTWQKFQEAALSLERLSDIMDTPQEQDESKRSSLPMPEIKGAITYENVSFRFKSSGPVQLDRINLNLPAGKLIAIVGQSGSGKSTLTKLLVRLYEPKGGRILLDGYDISKVELYSLRRQMGVVPQDPLLFDGTVEENIALTYPDATPEEIVHAAQIADAHEFIMNLPDGYSTPVGERGSILSGGQRQRIAIARTVLQQPRLLILDEATSALDYLSEQQVCRNLAREFTNRTVFFITHRLNTIKQADWILMMDAGSVVEQGTHDELMALQGRYYCLYQQQDAQV